MLVAKTIQIWFFLTLCLFLSAPVLAEQNITAASPEGTWVVEQYLNGSGILTVPLPDASITAQFSEESLTGTAGCNTYNTQYTSAAGALIILGPVMTTKSCLPSVSIQEEDFVRDLKNTALFQATGSDLLLYDDDEELLVSFIPVKV
ncbi:MAG: META domain-containing protein [Methanospirillum sp.]|uniref:META domain-containing protein n=1 Tax=Methanospirillum sp. TaxID=45200 RepID=UPI00236C0D6E|nr:META domain-containing protein [Methanospirillum sp.]MDD1728362.1 META domain-containing protein [Methanospirillum sp.]